MPNTSATSAVGQPLRARVLQSEEAARLPSLVAVLLITAHIPLALLIASSPTVATIHAVLTVSIGVILVLFGRKIENIAYISAYVMGCEVLWRAADAGVFWELGKYSTIVLMSLAIIRFRGLPAIDKRPLVYFIMLLPSLWLLPSLDREAIAFNLSGPLSLAVAVMFFSKVTLRGVQLQRLLLFALMPIIGLASVVAAELADNPAVTFMEESMKATSAGFGPNQVSSILGLGALLAVFYYLNDFKNGGARTLMMAIAIWLLAQAALTFSRGGVWTSLLAVAGGTLYLMRSQRRRVASIAAIALASFVVYLVVLPFLDGLTGGLLPQRFGDMSLTGREYIMRADWLAFTQHPVFGVGPGQSSAYHEILFRFSSAHTEYSRLLAEHGSFGLAAILLLVWLSAQRVFSKQLVARQAFVVACTIWALLYMFHSAMRLAAPGFIFGLASAHLVIDEEDPENAGETA